MADSVSVRTTPEGTDPNPQPPEGAVDDGKGGVLLDTSKVQQEQSGTDPQRPAWLPEKFSSPEDLAKAYAELESKLGGQKKEETPATPPTKEEAEKAVSEAGLDMAALSKEYAELGGLSEDTLKALEAKGITR